MMNIVTGINKSLPYLLCETPTQKPKISIDVGEIFYPQFKNFFNQIGGIDRENLLRLAILVLQKPPKVKSDLDYFLLYKATKNIKFFKDLVEENGVECHKICCKKMLYEFYQ